MPRECVCPACGGRGRVADEAYMDPAVLESLRVRLGRLYGYPDAPRKALEGVADVRERWGVPLALLGWLLRRHDPVSERTLRNYLLPAGDPRRREIAPGIAEAARRLMDDCRAHLKFERWKQAGFPRVPRHERGKQLPLLPPYWEKRRDAARRRKAGARIRKARHAAGTVEAPF
jgi:hypothetical protein